MRVFVLSMIAATATTPALAQEAPIEFDLAFTDTALIATPRISIPNIAFDLAKVGPSESTSETQTAGELPALTAEKAKSGSIISGGASLDSKYVFSDNYVQINSPTAKVYASVSLRDLGLDSCTADFFAAHGLKTKAGREFDFGASCGIPLADGIEATLGISRYVLGGLTDITTLEGTVKAGAIDLGLTQYVVDGAEADATKVEVGYTLPKVKDVSVRVLGVYENGFGLPNLLAAGVEASYALTKRLSLTGAVYTPISGAGPRKTQAVAGVSFSF